MVINLGSTKDKGKVSVVATFKNHENVAGRMVNSLINQTYKNLEIICVDDNSTDNTYNVLKEFSNEDERVVVMQTPRGGASRSRNLGIQHATGKFLIVVDGDDEMLLDGIENMVRAFDDTTDCVVAGFKQTKKDGTINMVMPEEKISGSPKDAEFFEKLMRYSNQNDVCCSIRMYLREKFKVKYKEDCTYGEHLLVCVQNLRYLDKITMLPMVVYNYSPFPYPKTTISNQIRGKEFDLMKQVIPEIQETTKSLFPNNKYLIYVSCYFLISTIFISAKNKLEMGESKQEVEKSITAELSDEMTQSLLENMEVKTLLDNTYYQTLITKDTNMVFDEIENVISANYQSSNSTYNLSSSGFISMVLNSIG